MLRLTTAGNALRNESTTRRSTTLWQTHRVAVVAACITLTTVLPSCGRSLAKPECEALLLRYVELLANSDRPDASSLDRLRFKQQAREKAAQDPEFAQCHKTVSRTQFDCAMIAPATDDFERCLM
jgi:hypothetical protein